MATVLSRIDAPEADVHPNRRRAPRAMVKVEASVRSSRGEEARMTIANISVHGCNITGEAAWLRQGGFVTVELGDGEAMSAIVRWVRDASAGLEFARPVPAGHGAWHELIDSIADM